MSILERLKLLHLLYFSKPATDRAVYRKIRRSQPRTIVEIGVGTARRSLRMIWLASRRHPAAEIRFTGIDRFESRSADQGVGISLREAHRLLKATGRGFNSSPATPTTVWPGWPTAWAKSICSSSPRGRRRRNWPRRGSTSPGCCTTARWSFWSEPPPPADCRSRCSTTRRFAAWRRPRGAARRRSPLSPTLPAACGFANASLLLPGR